MQLTCCSPELSTISMLSIQHSIGWSGWHPGVQGAAQHGHVLYNTLLPVDTYTFCLGQSLNRFGGQGVDCASIQLEREKHCSVHPFPGLLDWFPGFAPVFFSCFLYFARRNPVAVSPS